MMAYFVCNSDSIATQSSLTDQFVFFFKKDKNYYGADESSRVIFARMKNPDKDSGASWRKNASFSAINLKDSKQYIFNYSDLKSIKIIDKEEAEKQSKIDVHFVKLSDNI